MRSFEDLFKSFGFQEYPFAIFSAEGERKKLHQLFVRPAIYAPLVDTFKSRSSVVIAGERGTGKTALVYELMRSAEKDSLYVYVEDFSSLDIGHDQVGLYKFLLDNLTEAFFKKIAEKPWRVWTKSRDEKLLLSYLLKYHTSQVSVSRIEERIRKIQVALPKRLAVWTYNRIRGVLNYSATAALNISSDIVQKHFPGLPALDNTGHREYFPALRTDQVSSVEVAKANFSLLSRVADLCGSFGIDGVVFVIDKVDEEPRLENDAASIAEFLQVLLTDNKLLLHSGVQFLIACWSIPLEQLKARVRFQKLSLQRVVWQEEQLCDVLNQRLATFSSGAVQSFYSIFDEAGQKIFLEVMPLANGNPRDLWHLMDAIFKKQYELDSEAEFLGERACAEGARKFVSDFNFYEYYPRASGARSNTMDVYSYIAHLLKLSSSRFTKNQLSEQASTGSSTNNYVVAMENMGLIGKSDEKGEGGAVVYAVRDPKVTFARENGISIHRIS